MYKAVILLFFLFSLFCFSNASIHGIETFFIDIMMAVASMWPTGSTNMAQRKIALSITITILDNYTGTIGQGLSTISFCRDANNTIFLYRFFWNN